MNPLRFPFQRSEPRGFSLVETTLSLGLVSFSFLIFVPLLALGLKTSRQARDNRTQSQIAQTLVEEARQGTLSTNTVYLDLQGDPTTFSQAIYTVKTTSQSIAGNTAVNRLTLQVTPIGAPNRIQTYAVVVPAR